MSAVPLEYLRDVLGTSVPMSMANSVIFCKVRSGEAALHEQLQDNTERIHLPVHVYFAANDMVNQYFATLALRKARDEATVFFNLTNVMDAPSSQDAATASTQHRGRARLPLGENFFNFVCRQRVDINLHSRELQSAVLNYTCVQCPIAPGAATEGDNVGYVTSVHDDELINERCKVMFVLIFEFPSAPRAFLDRPELGLGPAFRRYLALSTFLFSHAHPVGGNLFQQTVQASEQDLYYGFAVRSQDLQVAIPFDDTDLQRNYRHVYGNRARTHEEVSSAHAPALRRPAARQFVVQAGDTTAYEQTRLDVDRVLRLATQGIVLGFEAHKSDDALILDSKLAKIQILCDASVRGTSWQERHIDDSDNCTYVITSYDDDNLAQHTVENLCMYRKGAYGTLRTYHVPDPQGVAVVPKKFKGNIVQLFSNINRQDRPYKIVEIFFIERCVGVSTTIANDLCNRRLCNNFVECLHKRNAMSSYNDTITSNAQKFNVGKTLLEDSSFRIDLPMLPAANLRLYEVDGTLCVDVTVHHIENTDLYQLKNVQSAQIIRSLLETVIEIEFESQSFVERDAGMGSEIMRELSTNRRAFLAPTREIAQLWVSTINEWSARDAISSTDFTSTPSVVIYDSSQGAFKLQPRGDAGALKSVSVPDSRLFCPVCTSAFSPDIQDWHCKTILPCCGKALCYGCVMNVCNFEPDNDFFAQELPRTDNEIVHDFFHKFNDTTIKELLYKSNHRDLERNLVTYFKDKSNKPKCPFCNQDIVIIAPKNDSLSNDPAAYVLTCGPRCTTDLARLRL